MALERQAEGRTRRTDYMHVIWREADGIAVAVVPEREWIAGLQADEMTEIEQAGEMVMSEYDD